MLFGGWEAIREKAEAAKTPAVEHGAAGQASQRGWRSSNLCWHPSPTRPLEARTFIPCDIFPTMHLFTLSRFVPHTCICFNLSHNSNCNGSTRDQTGLRVKFVEKMSSHVDVRTLKGRHELIEISITHMEGCALGSYQRIWTRKHLSPPSGPR